MGLLAIWCFISLIAVLFSCGGREEEAGKTPANKPPTVSIDSPNDFATYLQGDSIEFSGTAEDTEDGTLSGDSLVWTSNIDSQFGTGASFSIVPSPGQHEIILTATDSVGATGSEAIRLIISSNIDAK